MGTSGAATCVGRRHNRDLAAAGGGEESRFLFREPSFFSPTVLRPGHTQGGLGAPHSMPEAWTGSASGGGGCTGDAGVPPRHQPGGSAQLLPTSLSLSFLIREMGVKTCLRSFPQCQPGKSAGPDLHQLVRMGKGVRGAELESSLDKPKRISFSFKRIVLL